MKRREWLWAGVAVTCMFGYGLPELGWFIKPWRGWHLVLFVVALSAVVLFCWAQQGAARSDASIIERDHRDAYSNSTPNSPPAATPAAAHQ